MYKDEAAMALADAFITEYRKHDFRFPTMKSIRKSKWWIHFERAAELRHIEDWDAKIWVKCQFDKYGKILPFRLYGKKAQEAFQEYKHRYLDGEDDKERQLITSMLSTYKTIKIWCKKKNLPEINYNEYFQNNINKAERGQLSQHFLSICRPFRENFEGVLDDDALMIKRAYVYKNKRLVNKLKEVMGNDFY